MKDHFTKEKIQYNAPVWACILFILFLFFLPTGYQEIYREADQCVAKVLETDDSAIIDTGLVRSGEQRCKLEIISGKFKGEQTEGVNMLNGSLEQDKMFYPGDTAQVVVSYDGDEILMVTMIDHNRIPMELVMGAIFIIFLILFFAATAIFPLTTPGMIHDFKACGGFLMLATGFRMVKLKNFPTADMIPAMVLIMPMSWFWVTYVLPLVS